MIGRVAAAALATALVWAPPAGAQMGDNPFEVTAVATPTPGDARGDYRVDVRFDCPPGTYLYAERTAVSFPSDPSIGPAVFAKGKVKYDAFEERELEIFTGEASATAYVKASGRAPGAIFPLAVAVEYQGCTSEFCYFPQAETLQVAAPAAAALGSSSSAPLTAGSTSSSAAVPGEGGAAPPRTEGGEPATTRASAPAKGGGVDIATRLASQGYFLTYLGVFLSGILLSFTPCVFPIIPITVGVIGARGAGSLSRGFSLSLIYVLGMALTYAALGLFAAQTGALFGSALQNPWVIGFVVAVLGALALSMFGLFEIQVPSAIAGRLAGAPSKGGSFVGVFFMGIIAGLVASPCVGPVILGLLIFIATTGSALLGFTLLFTLGLGMGVLFLVIGTFSGSLSALPRAGVWMDRVKELFGVLLIAMAFYFMRPLLDPTLFGALVGLAALALAGFGGVFDAAGGGLIDRVRKTMLLLLLAVGIAAVGGALRATGLLFPHAEGSGTTSGAQRAAGIAWLGSESEGLEAARLGGMPVIIDFTADWCLVCHEIDEAVFQDPRVIAAARGFAMVRLDFTRVNDAVRALQEKYKIRGLPMVIFLDRDGRPLEGLTVSGFIEPEDFLARMEKAAL
jgi:thiol:disulfide interchange protein DsbD